MDRDGDVQMNSVVNTSTLPDNTKNVILGNPNKRRKRLGVNGRVTTMASSIENRPTLLPTAVQPQSTSTGKRKQPEQDTKCTEHNKPAKLSQKQVIANLMNQSMIDVVALLERNTTSIGSSSSTNLLTASTGTIPVSSADHVGLTHEFCATCVRRR